MIDCRHALLSAIYRALTENPALSGLLAGPKVYDHVPRAADFPFVAFGDLTTRMVDGDVSPLEEHDLVMLVYSRSPGRLEASLIAQHVCMVVEGGTLDLDGFRLVSVRHRDITVSESGDQKAYRARLRFRLLTEAN